MADSGNVEAKILLRLTDFDDDEAGFCQAPASLNGCISAFDGLYRHYDSMFHDDRLTDAETTHFFGDTEAQLDIFPLAWLRSSASQHTFQRNDMRQTQSRREDRDSFSC